MAAEIEDASDQEGEVLEASMRPRRMAAEIPRDQRGDHGGEAASMRPRRMAAEISASRPTAPGASQGFNEAAANGRGNR